MLSNANIYGSRVEKGGVASALLDCMCLSLLTAGDVGVPGVVGKREITEKADVVCERTDGGTYTAGRKMSFSSLPRKVSQDSSDDAASTTPDRGNTPDREMPTPTRSPTHAVTTPKSIKIRVHCATLFARISAVFDKSLGDVVGAIQTSLNDSSVVCSELASPGKGGSKFFFVGGLALKSLTESEGASLKALLPAYLTHVTTYPDTLLPKFFAWVTLTYRINGAKVTERFVVMDSVCISPRVIPTVYDIKGSTFLRDGGSVLQSASLPGTEIKCLKDNELKGRVLDLSEAPSIIATAAADTAFLEGCKIVDYSLLCGVRDSVEGEVLAGCDSGRVSTNGSEVYYIGIVDILQGYTASKVLETCLKGVVVKEDEISVIPPTKYASRFIRAVAKVMGVDLDEE